MQSATVIVCCLSPPFNALLDLTTISLMYLVSQFDLSVSAAESSTLKLAKCNEIIKR